MEIQINPRKHCNMKGTKILSIGQVIDYQTMIEEVVGIILAKELPYDNNYDKKSVIEGVKVDDKERGYFVGDADYEIIIRKRK